MSTARTRSFTLIETMLAATLGTLVLLGIMGVTALVDRSESGSAARLTRTNEMEQAQTVIRRALGSLAMAGSNAPMQQNRSNQTGNQLTQDTAAGVPFTPTPRLVLAPMEMDPFAAAALGEDLAGTSGGAQRVQLALTALPVPERGFVQPLSMSRLPGAPRSTEPESEDTLGATEGEEPLDPLAGDPSEETDTSSASELVPIFWGVLELTPPDVFSEDREREGWTLWWRQIPAPANPSLGLAGLVAPAGPVIADPRMDPSAVALVRGISTCKWSVYRGRALLPAYAATYSGELPAYMQLELRTVAGVYASWMFELGWATVQEPGQAAAAAAARSAAIAARERNNEESGRPNPVQGGAGVRGGISRPEGWRGRPGSERGPEGQMPRNPREFDRRGRDGEPLRPRSQSGGGGS